MVSASGVTIKNLTIEDAHSFEYGAAIYFEKSGTVTNCNFNSNLADSAGGAIYFIFFIKIPSQTVFHLLKIRL